MAYSFNPIGVIHSPYKQKFAIPRQPGLVSLAKGSIELHPPFNDPQAFLGIEEFSHLWITFIFHQTAEQGWAAQVRPPRLGGNRKRGVFATRSNFRPNPIGLSVVENLGLRRTKSQLFLDIANFDFLDATPVIDIKPYIPYSDSIEKASAGFAQLAPKSVLEISFSPQAKQACETHRSTHPNLQQFISQVLTQDPRAAHKKADLKVQQYQVYLYEFNVKFEIANKHCKVTEIKNRQE
ncbi:tRNA (N6-threonylcarbamoyladenosine(37)-N6)-methyltransferase TrmO [Aliikangiella sp. IMCC44632]